MNQIDDSSRHLQFVISREGFAKEWLLVACILFAFFFCCWYNIRLPGPQLDSMLHVTNAIRLLHPDIQGRDATDFAGTFVNIAGTQLPLFLHTYSGALRTYLLALWYSVWGISLKSTRFFTIACGLGTLLSVYLFTRRIFSRTAALLALVFLATDLSFITFSRADNGAIDLPVLLNALALLCLAPILANRDTRPKVLLLFLAGLFAGLSTYERVYPAWNAVALIIVLGGLAFFRKIKLSRVQFAWFLGGLFVGAAPLIFYNILSGFPLLSLIQAGGPRPTAHTSTFEAIISKFSLLLYMINDNLSGNGPFLLSIRNPPPPIWGTTYSVFPLLFWSIAMIATVGVINDIRRRNLTQNSVAITFLLGTLSLTFLFALVTPSADSTHHMMMLYPQPYILVGAVLVTGIRALGEKRRWFFVGTIVVLVTLVSNLVAIVTFHYSLSLGNFTNSWGTAIYQASDYLETQNLEHPVYILDWGPSRALMLLSAGKVPYLELFWAYQTNAKSPSDEFVDWLRTLIKNGNTFMFYTDGYEVFPPTKELFLSLLKETQVNSTQRQFYESNGAATLAIVTTIDAARENH